MSALDVVVIGAGQAGLSAAYHLVKAGLYPVRVASVVSESDADDAALPIHTDGATSAVQFLVQLNHAGAATTWVTRREPVFEPRSFDSEWGRNVERRVRERTGAGRPPESVVSVTALPLTPQYQRCIDQGILVVDGFSSTYRAVPSRRHPPRSRSESG